jgi:dTDP-4-dehydrorhamnose 3,5-epimerase
VTEKKINEFSEIELIPREKFSSELGSFSVTYQSELIKGNSFYQDSISILENAYTLKGMHFQSGKFAQGKLVTVLQGAVMDYFVDLRRDSPTFLDYGRVALDDDNNYMLFIPKGFAHGYMTLKQKTILSYKLDSRYSPENEVTLLWNDPKINIEWPKINNIHISKKDMNGLNLSEIGAQI